MDEIFPNLNFYIAMARESVAFIVAPKRKKGLPMQCSIVVPVYNKIGPIAEILRRAFKVPVEITPAGGSIPSTTCPTQRESLSTMSTSANGPMVQKFRSRTSPDRPV